MLLLPPPCPCYCRSNRCCCRHLNYRCESTFRLQVREQFTKEIGRAREKCERRVKAA